MSKEISSFEIDVLKEISNIGGGSAATKLAGILKSSIRNEIPELDVLEIERASELIGNPDQICISTIALFEKGLQGCIVIFPTLDCAQKLSGSFKPLREYQDVKQSHLVNIDKELKKIIESYAEGLAMMLQTEITITEPSTSIDMVGAIMDVPIVEYGGAEDRIILIKEKMMVADINSHCECVLILDINTVETIMNGLGM